jgi:hypothetical protein
MTKYRWLVCLAGSAIAAGSLDCSSADPGGEATGTTSAPLNLPNPFPVVLPPGQLTSSGGFCLDVFADNPNPGAAVDIARCNGTPAQTFTFDPNGGEISNTNSGLCLDDVWGGGAVLQMETCNGQPEQQWTIHGTTIKNASGHCLDVYANQQHDGQTVDPATCNGTGAQVWNVDGISTTILGPAGHCLDVLDGGRSPGAKLDSYQCNYTGAQQWVFGTDGTVRNPQSGLCLEIFDYVNGIVDLGTCYPNAQYQVWQRQGAHLVSMGKCLDVAGGSIFDNAAVSAQPCNGTPAQMWRIPADYMPGPAVLQSPWLVLLCQYQGTTTQPHTMQWYQQYFTEAGAGMGGLYDFMLDNSDGVVDLTGSSVRGWFTMPFTTAHDPGRGPRIEACLQAAMAADPSIDPTQYAGVAAMTNVNMDAGQYGTEGISLDPNGQNISVGGQEVLHQYGVPHARSMTGVEYGDPFDIQSCMNCLFDSNPGPVSTFAPFGPALNAAFRFKMGWMPASTPVLTRTGTYRETLHAINNSTSGTAVIISLDSNIDQDFYEVEYRDISGWDDNAGPSGVLIHEYRPREPSDDSTAGPQNSTYLVGRNGMWQPGETYTGNGFQVAINTIDYAAEQATVTITIP